jgi:Predicted transcriptional regulator
MKTYELILRLERIDQFIRLKATGSPRQFASTLGISVSMLYNYLDLLKNLGGPIIALGHLHPAGPYAKRCAKLPLGKTVTESQQPRRQPEMASRRFLSNLQTTRHAQTNPFQNKRPCMPVLHLFDFLGAMSKLGAQP